MYWNSWHSMDERLRLSLRKQLSIVASGLRGMWAGDHGLRGVLRSMCSCTSSGVISMLVGVGRAKGYSGIFAMWCACIGSGADSGQSHLPVVSLQKLRRGYGSGMGLSAAAERWCRPSRLHLFAFVDRPGTVGAQEQGSAGVCILISLLRLRAGEEGMVSQLRRLRLDAEVSGRRCSLGRRGCIARRSTFNMQHGQANTILRIMSRARSPFLVSRAACLSSVACWGCVWWACAWRGQLVGLVGISFASASPAWLRRFTTGGGRERARAPDASARRRSRTKSFARMWETPMRARLVQG